MGPPGRPLAIAAGTLPPPCPMFDQMSKLEATRADPGTARDRRIPSQKRAIARRTAIGRTPDSYNFVEVD